MSSAYPSHLTAARRRLVLYILAMVVASIPVLLDPGAVARGAGVVYSSRLVFDYFAASHALLVYVWIPAVVLGAFVLVLFPGAALVWSAGAARSAAQVLLLGLATSTVCVSALLEVTEAALARPLAARETVVVLLAAALAAGGVALWRAGGRELPTFSRSDRQVFAAALAGALVLYLALVPKFLWESFNGDGAHAFESARLLLFQAVPFWPHEAGAIAGYPGVTTFLSSYPSAWFVRLFGGVEAAVRLPYLLFLSAGLFPGIMLLIQHARERVPDASIWLTWSALAVFTVVMAFSATYSPYHADIALPGAQDALLIAWFLGFAWACTAGRHVWIAAFGLLTFSTSPAGLVLLAFWVAAAVLLMRPVPIAASLTAAGTMAAAVLLASWAPEALAALGAPAPGSEHGAGLVRRLLRVNVTDWKRVLYVVVPAGILPAFAIAAVRRQDPLARTVAAVALVQFLFFYVQARISLHYFAPAMVLPVIVFWRVAGTMTLRPRVLNAAVAACAGIALVLSLPPDLAPHRAARIVGGGIDERVGGYEQAGPLPFRASELLFEVFPRPSSDRVPDSAYSESPLAWLYYAHRPEARGGTSYVLQTVDATAPDGRLAAQRDGMALYITNDSLVSRDVGLLPPQSIAPIYRISKQTLFRGG
ncbi:MAG TPA: hypothetical protein VFZ24_09820 [Longimicrobiales bacterium]